MHEWCKKKHGSTGSVFTLRRPNLHLLAFYIDFVCTLLVQLVQFHSWCERSVTINDLGTTNKTKTNGLLMYLKKKMFYEFSFLPKSNKRVGERKTYYYFNYWQLLRSYSVPFLIGFKGKAQKTFKFNFYEKSELANTSETWKLSIVNVNVL